MEVTGSTIAEDITGDPDVAALLGVDPGDMPDAAVVDHLPSLHRLKAKVEGAISAATGVFDGRTVWAGDAARSGAGWLAARVDETRGRCRADIGLARDLRSMPEVDDAFREGRLGRAKVVLLAEVRTPELHDTFAAHEAYLVDEITRLRVADTRRFLRSWQQLARLHQGWRDPDDPIDEGPAPRVAINLSPTFDGRFVLDGEMDAEHGAIIRSVIDAEVDEMFRVGVFGLADGLTPAERRGQALAQVLLRKGRTGMRHGRPRPSVEVIIDEDTMTGQPVDDADDHTTRVCEIIDAGPVHPHTVQRLLCEGTAHRLVISADGEILDAGMDIRLANRAQRRALRFRHAGACAFPGCSAPMDWCEAHHIEHHDPDTGRGPTNMGNLMPLCRFHHHKVHEGGFTLTLQPDGTATAHRPDRSRVTPARTRRRPVEPHPLDLIARQRLRDLINTGQPDP